MVRMPLNNKARQQLRNLYALVQAAKTRTINVKRVPNNNKSMNKRLSPKTGKTKTGRPYKMWSETRSKASGKTYSIQTVRPNSRKVWNIV